MSHIQGTPMPSSPVSVSGYSASDIPLGAGIGLRARHYRDILDGRPTLGWLEVHSENYFGDGGQPLDYLERIRADHPLSLHGVGLSLGAVGRPDPAHLDKLARLVARFQPRLVSEHASWGRWSGGHLNDLLPLPRTEESLAVLASHVDEVQERLGRRILLENIVAYTRFAHDTLDEPEFLAALVARTGCGLLLDVNNVYVNARNHGTDPVAYLDRIPGAAVEEFHLAGFDLAGGMLIDTHGNRVAEPVWDLFRHAVARIGPRPTLIEWDTDIPALDVLLEEAARADAILAPHHVRAG